MASLYYNFSQENIKDECFDPYDKMIKFMHNLLEVG
jgi:hypothetical protein